MWSTISSVRPWLLRGLHLTVARPEAGAAERNIVAWVVLALAALRVVQLVPGLSMLLPGGGGAADSWPARLLFLLEVCWAAVMFTVLARARRTASIPWALGDAAVAAACVFVVGRALTGTQAVGWGNWALGVANGAALIAVGALGLVAGLGIALTLGGIYAASVWHGSPEVYEIHGVLVNFASLIGFTLAGWLIAVQLLRSARLADAASRQAAIAQRKTAAAEAKLTERNRQYALIHDTALSTLSAIARGGLDHRSPEVRARCAADAAYLRAIFSTTDDLDHAASDLNVALADIARRHASFGLLTHHSHDGLPDHVPPQVIDAIAHAANEALNNVSKHAGTNQAWITAVGTGDHGIAITIVDRGHGFDLDAAVPGRGLDHSLRDRLAAVGGKADIDSAPGGGTTVELRWPA